MNIFELYEYCKILAIRNLLLPSEETLWRSACRAYSKKFHVPLPEVLRMDPEHVFLTELEDQLDGVDPEEQVDNIYEQLLILEDPEGYIKKDAEELEAFVEQAEKVAQERRTKIEKSLSKTEERPPQNQPSGGSIDFSNLDEKLEK